MKHTPEKKTEMTRSIGMLPVILVAVIALTLGAAAPEVWAAERVEFDEAEIFFEFNSTDLDLGLHIFFDAEAWKEVEVKDKSGEEIFEVENDGSLKEIGSTEVFTESAEPPLCDEDEDDCDVDEAIHEFQARFPAGEYRFRGRTVDGKKLKGSAYLSHELPTAPEIDAPEDLANPFVIEWYQPAGGPKVVGYEVVAEMVIDGRTFVNTATLPGRATRFTVSREFIRLAARAQRAERLEEFKVEVIARAANLNKTITEEAVFELPEEE